MRARPGGTISQMKRRACYSHTKPRRAAPAGPPVSSNSYARDADGTNTLFWGSEITHWDSHQSPIPGIYTSSLHNQFTLSTPPALCHHRVPAACLPARAPPEGYLPGVLTISCRSALPSSADLPVWSTLEFLFSTWASRERTHWRSPIQMCSRRLAN